MSFFAVLLTLLAEQLKPLPRSDRVHDALLGWMQWSGRNFNAGREHHAWVVWCVTALVPTLAAWGGHLLLARLGAVPALAWTVAVLYLTLGFRQFSHRFTDIRDALERGDESQARQLLARWRHLDASELPRSELLRHVIEESLLAAHRHVFGVFFCFVVFAVLGFGPAGAVLYRMASFAGRYWSARSRALGSPSNDRLMQLSQWLFDLIDAAPARLTAFGFAVVGNFEEAVTCWRRDAVLWPHANEGVILAAAGGAVGVQLGGMTGSQPLTNGGGLPPGFDEAAEPAEAAMPGLAPQLGHLRSVVGLVWRSVVLWMLLLALLSLANLVG